LNPLDANSTEGRFRMEDLNSDGVISRSEWRGSPSTFNRLDVNRDGVLSLSEYAGNVAGNVYDDGSWSSRFAALDRNGDGVLSPWEWRGESTSFSAADLNGDNVISRDEYARLYAGYDPGYGTVHGTGYYPDQRFRDLDRNGDGRLTR